MHRRIYCNSMHQYYSSRHFMGWYSADSECIMDLSYLIKIRPPCGGVAVSFGEIDCDKCDITPLFVNYKFASFYCLYIVEKVPVFWRHFSVSILSGWINCSWSTTLSELNISGYDIYSNDLNSNNRGIIVYVSQDLSCKVLNVDIDFSEFLLIEIEGCSAYNTRSPAVAEGPRDAGVPVEIL